MQFLLPQGFVPSIWRRGMKWTHCSQQLQVGDTSKGKLVVWVWRWHCEGLFPAFGVLQKRPQLELCPCSRRNTVPECLCKPLPGTCVGVRGIGL